MKTLSAPMLRFVVVFVLISTACKTLFPDEATPTATDPPATETATSEPGAYYVEVEIMPNANHRQEGTKINYNTNPPSSGPHYSLPWPAGFYEEGDFNVEHPEGHVLHSLEHGYVAIWYNCELLSEAACETLKEQIREMLAAAGADKVMVVPWNAMDTPLAMTSWGMLLVFERFDFEMALEFIVENRSHPRAPEPNVP